MDAAGDPAEVLTADRVHAVFGLRSRVIIDPISSKPLVLPIGRHHTIVAVEGVSQQVDACATPV